MSWQARRPAGSVPVILCLVAGVWSVGESGAARPEPGGLFAPAFAADDVDLAACRTYNDGVPSPADPAEALAVLGLGPRPRDSRGWSAGEPADPEKGSTFHYLVAFKRPVALGSTWVEAGDFCYLRPDAPLPADPAKAEQWLKPPVHPGQGHPRLVTLPPGTRTQAVLLTERRSTRRSTLRQWRFGARRLHNVTPDAVAQAESEFTQYSQLGPPHTYHAARITTGTGSWQNTGKDQKERIPRPPVSDVDPSWFVLSWDEAQTLSGLFLRDNFEMLRIEVFRGPDTLSPVAAVENEWKRLADYAEQRAGEGRWIAFEPLKTRGIRLVILKTNPAQIARIETLHAYVDLGEAPVPAPRQRETAPPPFQIAYTLAEDRRLTMVVNDAQGRRVRNIVARAARSKGPGAESWDLRDERGNFVAPGTYEWKAIAYPPLELRYQMTPYPNIEAHHPENSPWLNGASGPGGWLADHTPPSSSATDGDFVFLGAPCAESGVSFIACTLEGRKLWGIHSFAAWSGPRRMAAADGKVFVENQGWSASGEEGMDRVWAVDVATQKVEELLMLSQTEKRQRGICGMAAAGGKLYMAIDAGSDWLNNAVGIGDVDIENCLPPYPRKKQSGLDYVPDPRDDFVRLFRIKGTPAGNNGGISYLESTKGPGRQQHIVLALKRPVAIGSLVLPLPTFEDVKLKISVLKPDAPYPPDAENAKSWTVFYPPRTADRNPQSTMAWDVVPCPPNTITRALRFTFTKGADDELEAALETTDEAKGLKLDARKGDEEKDERAWSARLEGAKLLRRRFRSLANTATVRVNSGKVAPDGSWDAERSEPVTADRPGIYVMEWPEPQRIRGIAIMEIDGKRTEIEAYDGQNAPADISAGEGWTPLATYEQARRYFYWPDDKMNANARYMDGYVDFGREVTTRAIRLRVVEQWVHRESDRAGCYGIRADRGGQKMDPTRCRIYGVAPLQPLGDEAPADPLVTRRIEVADVATKKITQEIPIEQPGPLALGPGGQLFCLSGTRVLKLDLAGGKHEAVVSDLVKPTALAADGAGALYVFDKAPDRQVVRVYQPPAGSQAAGGYRYARDLGTPGGFKVGPWDPTRFGDVSSLSIDKAGHLWAVEWQYWPKRIVQWTTDGKFLRELLGNTSYGGGGVLDPWNKRRVFYGNLEFELDWDKGATRLKNYTWPNGWEAGELPVKIGDRVYMVTRTREPASDIPVGIVYLYERDHLRRVAAVGLANYFPALRTPEILGHLGKQVLEDFQFLWSDRNGDGEPQLAEVTFSPKRIHGVSLFNRDLGVQAGTLRYQVKEFLPDGVPVYEEKEFPKLEPATKGWLSTLYRLDNGTFFHMGNPEAAYTPEGEMLWSYRTEGAGGHALNTAGPWHPAQVVCEFGWVGHETTSRQAAEGSRQAEGLGEFVVFKTNVGSWNVWTSDGLLVGPIFRDIRDPQRVPWAMRDHARGLRLDDVTAGQEHFCGYFGRSFEDGKYYAVAGHNHVSVVEVAGLEQAQRLGGKLTVAPDDVRKAQEWEIAHAKAVARQDVKVLDCFRALNPMKLDGSLSDWDGVEPTPLMTEDAAKIQGVSHNASLRMAYDDRTLYLAYEVRGLGPMKNSGNQWDKLFKTGAAADLHLGTDPAADPARKTAVAGDLRLLMTWMGDKPVAVLYRPVAPGARPEEKWEVVSPVWKLTFDLVKILDTVAMARSGGSTQYVVEAAIPLEALGLKFPKSSGTSAASGPIRLKLDWGVLATDADGTGVLGRHYWANKATSVLSDAPSEAALHPDLWGYVRVFAHSSKGLRMTEPKDLTPAGKATDDPIKLELDEE
ncbi:MAG TPA: hypothetical protein PLE19_07680 [Planctomycetota bacterium]|nr:hypothetical protein [Planctomycetota bacterium]HRR78937.1 hypothetical protein [Planctomycetota bacterium]HRT92785.1 hypothetical protein [Planctomycetota bacterium]